MNKYEQLQEFLNKCIELWWTPWNLIMDLKPKIVIGEQYALESNNVIWFDMKLKNFSIHDLFSKDSGLMEFVEWKPTMSFGEGNLKVRYNEMSDMTADLKITYFLENALLPTKQD